MAAAQTSTEYPARLEIDYPERLSRLTTLVRVIWVLPTLFCCSQLARLSRSRRS